MKKKMLITGLVSALAISCAACATSKENNTSSTKNQTYAAAEVHYEEWEECIAEVTDYESQTEVPKDATEIFLDEISGNLTIDAEGSYVLSGSLEGKVIVAVEGQVHLYLKGVNITSNEGAAIEISGSKKKVITLVDGYTNSLQDGESYNIEDSEANACLFSKKALTINGNGTLEILATGSYEETEEGVTTVENAKGINCKDELKILNNPNIIVTSGGDGIRGKDSVSIYGGTFTIQSGDDGIVSEGNIFIVDGEYNIQTGGGASSSAKRDEYTGSYKGIKNDTGTIYLIGGSLNLETLHNGIHSNNCIVVDGATLVVNCSDGSQERGEGKTYVHGHGLHSDLDIYFLSGNVTVTASYEGVEAEKIYMNGGSVEVASSDDGFNASSENGNDSDCILAINGGTVSVNAGGDGLDSNGDIVITGGSTVVDGPTDSGNGALDCGDRGNSITITGGSVFTIGTAGMTENASEDSTVTFSGFSIQDSIAAGTALEVYDGSTCILSATAAKNRNGAYIQIATEDTKSGTEYILKTSAGSTGFTAGENSAGGMGMGRPGGMQQGDFQGEKPNGDFQGEMPNGDFQGEKPNGDFGGERPERGPKDNQQ